MCTLAIAFRTAPESPLIVAANRDEALDRPSSPPFRWEAALPFVAPRDERAGGTWVGVNAAGLFVGITNRAVEPTQAGRRSRGQLVLDVLAAPSAAAARERLQPVEALRHNPFHLVYADLAHAFVSWAANGVLHHTELTPGLHIVTERSFGGDDQGRQATVRSHWPPSYHEESLTLLLGRHADNPLESVCVHAPAFNHGTRSSMVIRLASAPEAGRLLWAEGPPCAARFQDRSRLLDEVLRQPA